VTSNGLALSATSVSSSGGSGASLVRAFLELREPGTMGSTTPGARIGKIDFQFNPKELSLTKTAKWERQPARNAGSAGIPEFQGAEPCSMTLEMFFDASAAQDSSVVQAVDKLFRCCVPTDKTKQDQLGVPPWVVFHWGSVSGFTAYIASVAAKFTLFTPGGVPIRATATVTLKEIATEPAKQNPTSGGRAARRSHTLVDGDTLASVAHAEYGDPTLWRVLAEANGVDDPMRLAPGTTLLVPAADEIVAV
jgi:Contractile injection system tube protein